MLFVGRISSKSLQGLDVCFFFLQLHNFPQVSSHIFWQWESLQSQTVLLLMLLTKGTNHHRVCWAQSTVQMFIFAHAKLTYIHLYLYPSKISKRFCQAIIKTSSGLTSSFLSTQLQKTCLVTSLFPNQIHFFYLVLGLCCFAFQDAVDVLKMRTNIYFSKGKLKLPAWSLNVYCMHHSFSAMIGWLVKFSLCRANCCILLRWTDLA